MSKAKSNNRIDITATVSAINAPDSNFHALAERAGDYVDLIAHHNERGQVKSIKSVKSDLFMGTK